jgi:hypothetical protein
MRKVFKFLLTIALIVTMVFSGAIDSFGGTANGTGEIKVQLNGENLVFTDVSPEIVNGSTMVPSRQILEALGEGAAPFTDSAAQSACVPVRSFAESRGYCVDWDAREKTVVIFDPETLFGNADEDFSIFLKLIKTDLDYEQAYAAAGNFNMELLSYETAESALGGIDVSFKGEFSGIQQKSNADMEMSLTVDTDKMKGAIPPEDTADAAAVLDLLENISLSMKMDGEAGTAYMHSNIFSAMDPEIDENTWFKMMSLYEPYEEAGIDMQAFTRLGYSDMDLSELLVQAVSSLDDMDVSTYKNIKSDYTFIKNLIGDDAFRTETSGSIETHTLKIDKKAILAAIAKTAISEGIPGGALEPEDTEGLEDLADSVNFEVDLTIKEKQEKLYSYDVNGSFSMERIDCSFDAAGDTMNADVQVTLDMKDLMKIGINTESHMTETSKAPDLNPPSDAVIVEYFPGAPDHPALPAAPEAL